MRLAVASVLAGLFPTLRGAGGIDPWNVEDFLKWATGLAPTGGGMHAGGNGALAEAEDEETASTGRPQPRGDCHPEEARMRISEEIRPARRSHGVRRRTADA